MRSEGSPALTPFREAPPPGDRLATASCELPPHPEAVSQARRFARQTLTGWGMENLADDVALVVSELVTNALRHGVAAAGAPAAADGAPTVRLGLARWSSRLVCSVRDPSSTGPAPKSPGFTAESGRGLHLVASCTETWGWHPLTGAGKVVWALFPASGR